MSLDIGYLSGTFSSFEFSDFSVETIKITNGKLTCSNDEIEDHRWQVFVNEYIKTLQTQSVKNLIIFFLNFNIFFFG